MKASRSPPPGSPQGCSRACSAPSKQRPGSGASKMTLLGECPCQRGPRTCPIPPTPAGGFQYIAWALRTPFPSLVSAWSFSGSRAPLDQGAVPVPISCLCLICIAGIFFTYCLIFFPPPHFCCFSICPVNPGPPPVSRSFTGLPQCTGSTWLPAPRLASIFVSATWELGGTPSTSCSSPLFSQAKGKMGRNRADGPAGPCGTQGMASPPPAFFLTELGTCSARGCLLGNEGPLLCVLGSGALSRELPHAGAGVRGVTLAW